MRSRPTYSRGDLLVFGLSAVCIASVVVFPNHTIDIVFGLPLIVYLPGAAMVSALGSRRHRDDMIERQMWIVGASFGLTVAGGLVLNLAGGLTRSSWLVWVGAVIVLSNVVKLVLPKSSNVETPSSASSVDDRDSEDSVSVGGGGGGGGGTFGASLRRTALLLSAAAICVAAVVLSVHTNTATTREPFVQAWVLPRPSEDVTSTSVQVGLRNHLGYQRTFLVRVSVGTEPAKEFSVPLANGAFWTHVIARRRGERVESTVLSASKPSIVYSKVYLAAPVT